jgi:CubicO group peptidase (beta-lactamase class C family)
MKHSIIIVGLLFSISSYSQTGILQFQQMSLRQRIAKLFVVSENASEVVSMSPLGQIMTSLPRPTLAKGNGLFLADVSNDFVDSLSVPFPSGDVFTSGTSLNQRMICNDFLSLYPHVAGVITSLTSDAAKIMNIDAGMPLPERLIFFPDPIGSRQRNVAGVIRMPSELLDFIPATVQNPLNEAVQPPQYPVVTPIDPNKLGFTFNQLLQLPYFLRTDNLLLDVEKLCRAYENNQVDRSLVDARVKWAINCQLSSTRASSQAPTEEAIARHASRRARFNETSLTLVKNQNHFFPLSNINLLDLTWVDARQVKSENVKEVVQFFQYKSLWLNKIPETRLSPVKPGTTPHLMVLVDHQTDLPEVLLQTHRFKAVNPQVSVGLVLMSRDMQKDFVRNDFSCFDAVLLGFSTHPFMWDSAIQAVCGGIEISGRSPLSLPGLCNVGDGIEVNATRLRIGRAADVGMSASRLKAIDSLIFEAIQAEAIPGAQLLIARKGVVVYRKTYGQTSYQKADRVTFSHLYDIASVTKIMSSTPLLMHLYDVGRLDLNKSIGDYLSSMKSTSKADLKIYELLTHKAGLKANVPTFLDAIDRQVITGNLYSKTISPTHTLQIDDRLYLNSQAKLRSDLFQSGSDSLFSIEVAKGVFMNHHYLDSIWTIIQDSPLDKLKAYKYSDMGLVIMQRILEQIEQRTIDRLCDSILFRPMGIGGMAYRPLNLFAPSQIVPTENDQVFRKQLLRGYVHDPGAAMMGGVAGHAGLFATVDEVAKMMQMYLNKGSYGGNQFFKPQTVDRFISQYNSTTRRGLGFDKPETDPVKISPVCENASPLSFGHTGFTGTIAWADPESGLIFVFLSNRVHPDGWNRKLISTNVRNKAMTMAYEAIITK